MENFKIHLHNIPEAEEGDLKKMEDAFSRGKKEKTEKIPGEYEKTEEELDAINVVNDLIHKELKELEIETDEYLTEDRVHLISQEIADSLHISLIGIYGLEQGHKIIINKDRLNGKRFKALNVFIHEAVHYYSFHSIMLIGGENKTDIGEHRTGYVSKNSLDTTSNHEHFRGLNEAVTEKITWEIIEKNKDFLIEKFDLRDTKFAKEGFHNIGYKMEISIVDFIIKKIAEFYKKEPEEIWTHFKKGLFTGEMMHLREVEEVFGPGSLRVLAAITSRGSIKNLDENTTLDNLKKFFEEENQEERNKIAKKIFSERERLQYEKILKNDKDRNVLE